MKFNHIISSFIIASLILWGPGCKKYYADGGDSTDDGGTNNNIEGFEESTDYTWNNSEVISIKLNGAGMEGTAEGVKADGSLITITASGTYLVSGSLTNGQLLVNCKDDKIVRLILNGVNITCSNSSPLFVKNATKALIVLADNSSNYFTDGSSYVVDSDGEPSAAVFSKSYLSFSGTGTLTVKANYSDGITSKDGLVVKSGKLVVTAKDDGIRGKDYLLIHDVDLTLVSGGDGLKSDNETDSGSGYITIESGVVKITTTAGDGITAAGNILIDNGEIGITTGGGAGSSTPSGPGSSGGYSGSASEKGIKTPANLTINMGTVTINSADDALHSTMAISLNGGIVTIASGDDAIHGDGSISFSNLTLNVTRSYEGFESPYIQVKSGNISLVSTDDGFNASKGQGVESDDGSSIQFTGGNTVINSSSGDAIDSNGSIVMTGGVVVANGPQSAPEVGIDVNGTFNISGGLLLATGPNSGNMIEGVSTGSSQYSVMVKMSSQLSSSTFFHIQDSDGNELVSYKPVRSVYYVVFSSPSLVAGKSYSVFTGGSTTGTASNGLYNGGTYSGGTLKKSFTVSSKVTSVTF